MSEELDDLKTSINGSYDRLKAFLDAQTPSPDPVEPDPPTETGITRQQRHTIRQWVNSVETGSPEGNYGDVTRYKDGKQGAIYQYTLGRSQTSEAGGHVRDLIERYKAADKENKFDAGLNVYLDLPDYTLASMSSDVRKPFEDAFKAAGDDPDMHLVQDKFFDERYFVPAYEWFVKQNFKDALSFLVVYDSFIHSGGIFDWLRKRFVATPADEHAWVSQYTQTRHEWLKNHSRPLLVASSYRTKSLLDEIKDNNWDLDLPLEVNGIAVNGVVPPHAATDWNLVEKFLA